MRLHRRAEQFWIWTSKIIPGLALFWPIQAKSLLPTDHHLYCVPRCYRLPGHPRGCLGDNQPWLGSCRPSCRGQRPLAACRLPQRLCWLNLLVPLLVWPQLQNRKGGEGEPTFIRHTPHCSYQAKHDYTFKKRKEEKNRSTG